MTNQMKMILKISLLLSLVTFITSIVVLLVGGIGYLHAFSYVVLAVSGILFLILLFLYIDIKSDERAFKQRIAYYKLLRDLRTKAVLDFYNKFGLKPQYNKDGELLTPDELLGILTALDAEGNLDPAIYERLGILPRFDENGKEIPQILVLKHLIRSVKKEGLGDVKKLKGLYAKGTKKEKTEEKKPEKKAKAEKKKEVKKQKAGAKKAKKLKGTLVKPKTIPIVIKEEKKTEKKTEKKVEEKQVQQPTQTPEQHPEVKKVDPQEIKKLSDDYLKKIYAQNKKVKELGGEQPTRPHAEYGECTPE